MADKSNRPSTPESLAADLRATAADLDGYIVRRAAELAQPVMQQALADAQVAIEGARAETQRRQDVIEELGRYNQALDRQVISWRDRATGKTGDFILRNDEVREGDLILDCDAELETVLRIDVYDDHLGIGVTRADGRQSYLDRQPDALTAVRRELAGP